MALLGVAQRICGFVIPTYFAQKPPSAPTSEPANTMMLETVENPVPKLRPTASLDGLRGIAALFVFFGHILFSFSSIHEVGFGVNAENTYIFQLPILRLVYSGHAMVTIFFVVGGYVLSIRPVQMMHSWSWTPLFNNITSTCFRRGFRLYIPAVIATFITMWTIFFGLWEYSRSFLREDHKYIGFEDHHIERMPTLGAQLADWTRESMRLTNVFTYWSSGYMMPWYPRYDPHLWTIPIEMRSSILTMLLILVLARCRTPVRLGLMAVSIVFVAWWDHWELVCFLVGSFLCQVDHIILPKASDPILPTTTIASRLSSVSNSSIWTIFTFVSGLYLLSTPPQLAALTPGFGLIAALTPSCYTDAKRFPFTIGAALVVFSILRSPILRKPFMSHPAQYLGKISFSLYIVHGPLIHMVGFSLIPTIWNIIGMESTTQWITGYLLGSAILTVIVLGTADAYFRWVEKWSMTVSRGAETWSFIQEDSMGK
jgi:peptidoglycan/LPS O-acetylase OafA/YrhL